MGNLFDWRDAYALGIPAVDAEHRQILDALASVDRLRAGGGDHSEVRVRLARLSAVTRWHFQNEEDFLERLGYPEVERQRSEHAAFVEHLDGLALGDDPGLPSQVAFVRDWFVDHVIGTDRCYTRWLSRGAGAGPLDRLCTIHRYGALVP
jgi:hemerythrin-like metal-binding protein